MLVPFDKPENLSTTFDKAQDSDKPTNPTDDSITNAQSDITGEDRSSDSK